MYKGRTKQTGRGILMKLQDIADMKEYLENRCYCPYEIYDMTGFFFEYFKPETECSVFAEGERGAIHGTFVFAKDKPDSKMQIIYIEHKDNVVNDCVRFDATKNNVEQILKFMRGEIEKMSFDEYGDTKTVESLEEIFSLADAIMI